MQYFMHAFVTF